MGSPANESDRDVREGPQHDVTIAKPFAVGRFELTVGDRVIRNQIEKRMVEMRLMLTGQIPDGLLFRVSSIDQDPARAFAMQRKFVAELMAAVPGDTRRQLSGLGSAAPPG